LRLDLPLVTQKSFARDNIETLSPGIEPQMPRSRRPMPAVIDEEIPYGCVLLFGSG
jgi:hypothetical protein